jgi:hypothetical protein
LSTFEQLPIEQPSNVLAARSSAAWGVGSRTIVSGVGKPETDAEDDRRPTLPEHAATPPASLAERRKRQREFLQNVVPGTADPVELKELLDGYDPLAG